MLYIRVDGNAQIGAGHIMRCLAIAEALKERGKVTIFLTADEESQRLIAGRGFATLNLQTTWNDMEGELPILLPILQENDIKLLLIDSYCVTDTYLRMIGTHTQVVYLDDLGEHCYPVAVLANYNIYAPKLRYEEQYRKCVLPVPKLILGCDYVPLRTEFQNAEARVRRNVRDILLTTGGSDPYNIAGQLLDAIVQADSRYHLIQFHVVSGVYNKNINQLKILEKENLNIHIYSNVRHMANLMNRCDVAIAACGSTMYELAALGIPTVCFRFADNQKLIADSFGETLSKYAGDYEEDANGMLHHIITALDTYIDSYESRRIACENMMQVLDGDGASRMAEQFMELGV
ncbi:MAG: UDP-2,4-diacetamido-2,4,6-trideoxy-beta-L-altropyranose hydrolase [Lachnospiraceae bacterium]